MNRLALVFFFPIIIGLGCKEDEVLPRNVSCDDCLNLSELKNNTLYDSTFSLFDDLHQSNLILAKLNGKEISLTPYVEFSDAGFYTLELMYKEAEETVTTSFQFVIIDMERGETEWGIKKWTPTIPDFNLDESDEFELIFPQKWVSDKSNPVIIKVKNGGVVQKSKYGLCTAGDISFNIKRGIGSVQLPSIKTESITIGSKIVEIAMNGAYGDLLTIKSPVNADTTLKSNTAYHITNDLYIESGANFTIPEGVTIIMDEGINIHNSGSINISGTLNNPVHITSANPAQYWGGFISSGQNAGLTASHAFFCRSGYHNTGEYVYGHANRQALFRIENSTLEINNCYMLDHIGQVFYPINSTIRVNDAIVMRAKTGGEISHSEAELNNVYFSDFPDDSQTFLDEDNDALYLSNTNATIDHCTFMYAKDDGLDTGSDEGGTITITNSHFEACFHEGLAMSCYDGAQKQHKVSNSVFTRCGQGAELGFSSSNHRVELNNCLAYNNLIGIRYGDNYSWAEAKGEMTVTNSYSIHNLDKDIWNMVRSTWAPKLNNLQFENMVISIPTEQYPNLEIFEQ